MTNKTAVLLGATGLTGNHLLHFLIKDPSFSKIILISRRSVGFQHEKIEEHLMDLFELKKAEHLFKADVVFCAIGTTKAKTPDPEIYEKIDYGIPVEAARLTAKNNSPKFIVISALGAHPESKILYNRLKGKMEHEVLAEKIPHTYILRPSLISGDRKENRLGENLGLIFMKTFNFLIPKKYKLIESKTIAKAMWKLTELTPKNQIIPSDQIKVIAETEIP